MCMFILTMEVKQKPDTIDLVLPMLYILFNQRVMFIPGHVQFIAEEKLLPEKTAPLRPVISSCDR